MTTWYHVYAEDGFESGHKTLRAAERAAQNYANRSRSEMRVYASDVFGVTGAGRGQLVSTAKPKPRR